MAHTARFTDRPTTDDGAERDALVRRLHQHAEPIIQGILRQKGQYTGASRQTSYQSQEESDAEDIRGEVFAQLLSHIDAHKNETHRIHDLRAYIAVTTFRACDQHLRNKYPERARLKDRLRYLLTHRPGLALWEGEDAVRIGGLRGWQEAGSARPTSARLQQLRENPRAVAQAALRSAAPQDAQPAALLEAIFSWVGHPIPLEDLVHAFARLWDIKEITLQTAARAPEEAEEEAYTDVSDPCVDVASEVSQRLYLQQLWQEISALPSRQAAALLLNLRDTQGRGVIALFPLSGIATLREIAAVVGLSAEEFAAVWNHLPLEDAAIAEQLGVTRQQVINLRKVARERLARRVKAFTETL
jgi:hypothetical protein